MIGGYARYDTPQGEAGYAAEDVCHHDGCHAQIDRGLSYLCGDQPDIAADGACGRWYCADHPKPQARASGAKHAPDDRPVHGDRPHRRDVPTL